MVDGSTPCDFCGGGEIPSGENVTNVCLAEENACFQDDTCNGLI